MPNTMTQKVAGKAVTLTQKTGYPYDGDIEIAIDKTALKKEMALKVRIPGWVRGDVVPSDLYTYVDGKHPGYTVTVNGVPVESALEQGYFTVTRKWKKGDKVVVHFDLEPRVVKAHAEVKADVGRIAVERGPVVYCAEWPDNPGFSVRSVLMNQEPQFTVKHSDELFGLDKIATKAQTLSFGKDGRLEVKDVDLTLIPYYAWCHRGSGEMAVWLPQDLRATKPSKPATLASTSKIDASTPARSISAVNDQLVPGDESSPYYHWWPKQGGTEWITYDFAAPATVSRSSVWWFDDQPWGGCSVPKAWRISYKDASGNWVPVEEPSGYPLRKGAACDVRFKPVTTSAVRLEVDLPAELSAGLYEWDVK